MSGRFWIRESLARFCESSPLREWKVASPVSGDDGICFQHLSSGRLCVITELPEKSEDILRNLWSEVDLVVVCAPLWGPGPMEATLKLEGSTWEVSWKPAFWFGRAWNEGKRILQVPEECSFPYLYEDDLLRVLMDLLPKIQKDPQWAENIIGTFSGWCDTSSVRTRREIHKAVEYMGWEVEWVRDVSRSNPTLALPVSFPVWLPRFRTGFFETLVQCMLFVEREKGLS